MGLVVELQVQTPTETPPLLATPGRGTPLLPDFIQLPEIPWLTVVFVLVTLGLIVIVIIAVFFVSRFVGGHPLGKKVGSWLTSPGVDAIVYAIDPFTREARLIPVKRIGSLYVGIEEPAYIVPMEGGESYTLAGAGKPTMVALKYGKYGVQWVPALHQFVNLSLLPLKEGGSTNLKDLVRKLVTEIVTRQSMISGEIFIGPDIKLYISTDAVKALEALNREVAYSVATSLAAVHASVQSVAEEGVRILEAHRRLVETTRITLIIGIIVITLIIAVVVVMLKITGVF